MSLSDRFTEIRARLAQLRYQVRPEGEQAFASLSVAVDQAEAEAAAGGAAIEPTAVDVQLAELVDGAAEDRATLAGVVGTLAEIRAAVGLPA